MKTTIFAALLCAFSLTALADDYTLYVETTAGSSAYAYDDLQRITFKDGQMVIETKSGETSAVGVSSIGRMYFSTIPTSIETEQDVLETNDAPSAIYDLTGRKLSEDQNLPGGIYVVKKGGKTTKIVKK